jgi:hypothetical protein
MERSRLDQVHVDVAGNLVEIAWAAEREWLLRKVETVAGFETIDAQFEAVGASRPVELDFDERAGLRAALEVWERELTDGLTQLLDALVQAAPRSEA